MILTWTHTAAPILDVDWKNSSIFATSSSDKTIYVAKVGEESPIKAFVGHTDEVNCIKWDSEGGWKLPPPPHCAGCRAGCLLPPVCDLLAFESSSVARAFSSVSCFLRLGYVFRSIYMRKLVDAICLVLG